MLRTAVNDRPGMDSISGELALCSTRNDGVSESRCVPHDAPILISWKLALIAYIGAGIYLAIQRNRANQTSERCTMSDFDRMEDVTRVRPTVHALRTQLDDTDRRLMAIDDHINSTNDELAREIEALREEK